ncbi:MAG: hypothetical protein RIQ99_1460 [Pseudomonadota bacterium]|jgi:Flp pilus assembly protein TadG
MIPRWLQRRQSWLPLDQRGVAAIEYAIVLPVLLAFMFGIMETGRVLWYKVSLQRATAVATRCGAVSAPGCTTAAGVAAKAAASAPGIKLTASVFTVNLADTCGVRVSAALPYTFSIRKLGTPSITLTANDCHPKTQ